MKTKIWKQKRPTWCKQKNCGFRKRHQDSLCGGFLPSPEPHGGDFNHYRFCIRFENGKIIDIKTNASDLNYLRSIFDALDGQKTSWLTGGKNEKT